VPRTGRDLNGSRQVPKRGEPRRDGDTQTTPKGHRRRTEEEEVTPSLNLRTGGTDRRRGTVLVEQVRPCGSSIYVHPSYADTGYNA
jgi:hypothetical protein